MYDTVQWLAGRLAGRLFGQPPVIRRPSGEVRMVRWTVWRARNWGIYLHCIDGSDGEVVHDHPWPFVSVILAGGYWETTTRNGRTDSGAPLFSRWYGPGRILWRSSRALHRVDVPEGRSCWTLFFYGRHRGSSTRFWCQKVGWVLWRAGIGGPDGCDKAIPG